MNVKKRNLYLILFFGIQLLLMNWIQSVPSLVENYYSNGVYPIIGTCLRLLFGWIPFSVGDGLLFFIFIYLVHYIFGFFKTNLYGVFVKFTEIMAVASIVYFSFYMLWGLNYFRAPISKKLGITTTSYSDEQLINLSTFLISKLNTTQLAITGNDSIEVHIPYSNEQIYLLAKNGFVKLSKEFPAFTYNYGRAKSSLMGIIQSYNGTSGYLNPFTGEAQVNGLIPKTSLPTTTCHEMAHQLGYAAENEANFVGFLAALSNEDPFFKYAAYRMATRYVILELYKRDQKKYWELYKFINKGIIKDFKTSKDFWKKFENPFEPIVKKGYNAYLKTNNQKEGIRSYNYVVNLLVNYIDIKDPVK